MINYILRITSIFTLSAASFITPATSVSQENWTLERDSNGIKIWTRYLPNSSLKEFRATTILQTTPAQIITLMKDVSRYDKWMYRVDSKSARVVKFNNADDYYYYFTMSVPMIKTRDAITHIVFQQPDKNGVINVSLETAPNVLPENSSYVRIKITKGTFKIVPLDDGKVEFTHQAYGSPGGNIPDALVNMSFVETPYYMLTNIKKLLP